MGKSPAESSSNIHIPETCCLSLEYVASDFVCAAPVQCDHALHTTYDACRASHL